MLERRVLLVGSRNQGGLCKRSMGGMRFYLHLSLIRLDYLNLFRGGKEDEELS